MSQLDAPDLCAVGHLFVCGVCGKTSATLGGDSPDWDESCMLNAAEFAADRLVWDASCTRVVRLREESK